MHTHGPGPACAPPKAKAKANRFPHTEAVQEFHPLNEQYWARSCAQSRRRGFRGRIAIHPGQVDTINEAFTPSEKEREHARRVVDAFAAQPDAGTVAIDGLMYDIPHLKQARQTLGLAA